MGLEAVIFDNDGVITDSEIVYGITLTDIAKLYGVNESVETISTLTAGRSIEKALSIIEETYGISLASNTKELWDEKAHVYFESNLKACNGMLDVLKVLSEDDSIKIAVASTSETYKIVMKHKSSGAREFFADDQLFSGEDVENHKPFPDVYLYAASGTGVNPVNCLAVEDSFSGVKAGKAAGMKVVGYLGASHIFDKAEGAKKLKAAGADYIIEHASELLSIIEELK